MFDECGWPGRAILVQTNQVIPKGLMLAAAEQSGFGSRERLSHLFGKFQKLGLVGLAVGKESRRGGAGLWHPVQGVLWIHLLRNHITNGVALDVLPNLPVGFWLFGTEGIETSQAQRAFNFWAQQIHGANRPKGSRSRRRRVLDERVRILAAPEASAQAQRELRRLFESANDFMPETGVPRQSLVSATLDVLPPGVSDLRRSTAEGQSVSVEIASLVLKNLDRLVAHKGEAFWEWARRMLPIGLARYRAEQPELAAQDGMDRLYRPVDGSTLIQTSCVTMLTWFGLGLRMLRTGRVPTDLEAPPPL